MSSIVKTEDDFHTGHVALMEEAVQPTLQEASEQVVLVWRSEGGARPVPGLSFTECADLAPFIVLLAYCDLRNSKLHYSWSMAQILTNVDKITDGLNPRIQPHAPVTKPPRVAHAPYGSLTQDLPVTANAARKQMKTADTQEPATSKRKRKQRVPDELPAQQTNSNRKEGANVSMMLESCINEFPKFTLVDQGSLHVSPEYVSPSPTANDDVAQAVISDDMGRLSHAEDMMAQEVICAARTVIWRKRTNPSDVVLTAHEDVNELLHWLDEQRLRAIKQLRAPGLCRYVTTFAPKVLEAMNDTLNGRIDLVRDATGAEVTRALELVAAFSALDEDGQKYMLDMIKRFSKQ